MGPGSREGIQEDGTKLNKGNIQLWGNVTGREGKRENTEGDGSR